MAGHCLEMLNMAGMAGNGQKLLEYCWNWLIQLEMAENGCKLLEMAKNGWKWLEMTGNG